VTAVRADRYKHLFTKELLMGPNAVRLLEEMLENHPIRGGRVLDLGCGTGLTSLFLARETGAEQIFAVDLWIPATENWKRIREWGEERKIIPLHADARDLPFPEDFFDVIVSMDSYHYYGCQERFFAEKMLPLIRPGGRALLLVPGLKREFEGDGPGCSSSGWEMTSRPSMTATGGGTISRRAAKTGSKSRCSRPGNSNSRGRTGSTAGTSTGWTIRSSSAGAWTNSSASSRSRCG